MKISLFGHAVEIHVQVHVFRPIKIEPSDYYLSQSKNRWFLIADMQTDHIRNALLKQLGLSHLRYCESEVVAKNLKGMTITDIETLGLYREFVKRVSSNRAG